MALAINYDCTCCRDTCNTQLQDALTDYSVKDAPWDTHRAQALDVQGIYAASEEFERYAIRISACSGVLRFGLIPDMDSGELLLKLREAQFCRCRHCPVCQWRRSLMWQARFLQALPALLAANPSVRWIFLTITVRNVPIEDLAVMLKAMNIAWRRLIQRKECAPVRGWIRSTEVTRGVDGSAHPHFHVLMMVPPSMLGGGQYIKQTRWVALWRECARLDYDPIVDVRAVKAKPGASEESALHAAVAETLKYSVKPSDMVADDEWLLEMTRQVHKKRFMASGGVLKDVLRPDEESDEDLVLSGDKSSEGDNGMRLEFSWRERDRRYRRVRNKDSS